MNTDAIRPNLTRLREEIAIAVQQAGRPTDAVSLIAVSKTQSETAVRAAVEAGQLRFGENRVQEAARKFPPPPAHAVVRPLLHLIGPLQTNKAREAVRIADVLESLDRIRLADALADAIDREGRCPELLVQVNVGREPQKAGVAPEEADTFIQQMALRFKGHLRGLMCVPPADHDPAPFFLLLAAMARRHGLGVLSMGMSADYKVAIACGATWVRLGSAVFGHRS